MGIQERREREKERRRRDIQNAAKQLFMEKGYHATSIEDIAALAELGVATIYQYFSSKDELYASLNLLTLQFLVVELEKIRNNRKMAPTEKVTKVVDALYKTYQHDPLTLRIIFHIQIHDTLRTVSKDLLLQLNQVGQQGLSLMAAIYEEGARAGEFYDEPGMVFADIMWSMFAGLVLWEDAKKKMNPGKDFLKPTLYRAFEVFCRGIRLEPQTTAKRKRIREG